MEMIRDCTSGRSRTTSFGCMDGWWYQAINDLEMTIIGYLQSETEETNGTVGEEHKRRCGTENGFKENRRDTDKHVKLETSEK